MSKEALREQIENEYRNKTLLSNETVPTSVEVADYILNDLSNNADFIQYLIDQGKVGLNPQWVEDIKAQVWDINDLLSESKSAVIIPTVKGEGGVERE